MDYLLNFATIAALIGAYLVSIGRWQGFAIWVFTNFVFALNAYFIGQYQMLFLFLAYQMLAINGVWNMRFKKEESK